MALIYAPKHVATHRFASLDWQNSHALQGDLTGAIRPPGGVPITRYTRTGEVRTGASEEVD
jgi:hypothetical protein